MSRLVTELALTSSAFDVRSAARAAFDFPVLVHELAVLAVGRSGSPWTSCALQPDVRAARKK